MAWVKISTKTTDSNGAVTFDDLPYGNYRLEQTTAKTGYTPQATPLTIAVNSTTPVVEALSNQPAATGTLKIDKFSLGYPLWKLAGGRFKLMDSTGKTMLAESAPSDAAGVVTFPNLMTISGSPQSYKVVEVTAPSGYEINTQEISSSIEVNTTTTSALSNIPLVSGAIDVGLADANYTAYGLDDSDYDLYVEVL